MVACPLKNCNYSTNVYSSFNAHKSRKHSQDTAVHVPVLEMIQKMFRHTDILEKIQETKMAQKDEQKLPLLLYIDDLEIANPLGTSQKIYKLSSVYWMLADLPSKFRSALHRYLKCRTFSFATKKHLVLCYETSILELDGVFIESIGKAVWGTVMLYKVFQSQYVYRLCTATGDKVQSHDVGGGEFCLRTKASHDSVVHAVMHGDSQSQCGVHGDCDLSQSLEYFHTVTGFPPDVLHDLFEGIVPVELALCIGEMIRCKYFTLEYLNRKIMSFPYQHTDKVDRSHPIPKTFAGKLLATMAMKMLHCLGCSL
ncbi:hypothetical protein N1851_006855 [Merluccius polli]|uniref:Uncharacterized protein n=1 Tax=Merluccius polli TaxID=89951 RepID=A0AA47N4W0_MERPO|nr:hypothetical protein N1851_006855 [Merluccius polli]